MNNQQRTLININEDLGASLDDLRRDIFLNLKCHDVAKIVSVNLQKQTLQCEINYKRTMMRENDSKASTGSRERFQFVPREEKYPVLIDVPFIVMRGGSSFLNIPIKVGQDVLLLYNDRAIDDWFVSGKQSSLSSPRLHSMADAMALVGVSSMKDLIQGYDADRIGLVDGDSKIMVGQKLELKNAYASLGPSLDNLLQALSVMLQTMSTATPANVSATVGASAATAKVTVDQIKTQLEQLLE